MLDVCVGDQKDVVFFKKRVVFQIFSAPAAGCKKTSPPKIGACGGLGRGFAPNHISARSEAKRKAAEQKAAADKAKEDAKRLEEMTSNEGTNARPVHTSTRIQLRVSL